MLKQGGTLNSLQGFFCFLYYLTLTKKGVFLCQNIILCHCTCVIVINVDTCNEHDTTLNHTKSIDLCFILGELWRKVKDNVPYMVAHSHFLGWFHSPLSIKSKVKPIDRQFGISLNFFGSILDDKLLSIFPCPYTTVNSHKYTMNYSLNEVLFYTFMVLCWLFQM